MKFYKCMHCGNVAVKVHDAGVPLVCCGEKMKELIAGESDGAAETRARVFGKRRPRSCRGGQRRASDDGRAFHQFYRA